MREVGEVSERWGWGGAEGGIGLLEMERKS